MKHILALAIAVVALAGCTPSPPNLNTGNAAASTTQVLPAPPSQVAAPPQIGDISPAMVDISPKIAPPTPAQADLMALQQATKQQGPKPHTDMGSLANPHITVHKGACGCCEAWIKYLEENGFVVSVKDETDMNAFKDRMGVPGPLRACHTGEVEGLFVEGHVPAEDIRKMLKDRKKNKSLHGIGVAGMPAGSPGMNMGTGKDPYEVMAVSGKKNTQAVFAKH